MKSGDLSLGAAQLADAFKTLRRKWTETTEVWHDPVQRDFEEQYLAPLEPAVTGAAQAIARLGTVFAQARQECQ
jgi:hypothetical protein